MSFTPQHFLQIQAAIRIVKATYEDLPCVDYSDDLKATRDLRARTEHTPTIHAAENALRISLTPNDPENRSGRSEDVSEDRSLSPRVRLILEKLWKERCQGYDAYPIPYDLSDRDQLIALLDEVILELENAGCIPPSDGLQGDSFWWQGKHCDALTYTETRLLTYLWNGGRPRECASLHELIEHVWDEKEITWSSLKATVSKLNAKLTERSIRLGFRPVAAEYNLIVNEFKKAVWRKK
jgi:hypothetical protein